MKILVTGATGFVGSALCRSLCQHGHDVVIFRRPTSSLEMLRDLPLRMINGDLSDENSVEAAVSQRPEAIFHLGAQLIAARSPQRMFDINVNGTRRVLLSAQKYGVSRVVLMSSAYTMGIPERPSKRNGTPVPINETHCWNASAEKWPYAWSKYLAEKEGQLASANGIDVVTVNPCLISGPGDHYRRSSSYFLQLKKKTPTYVIKGGINVIPIQDVVTGLEHACEYGERGERYLLCGHNLSFRKLIDLCADAAGFPKPALTVSNRLITRVMDLNALGIDFISADSVENNLLRFAGRFFYYDPAKSRLRLHLKPAGDIAASLRQTYNWFEENA